MEKQIILTGDRPSGRLHLGHFMGSLKSRVELQNDYNQYVMIADLQALTDNSENSQKVVDNVVEVAMDYLSVGIDPLKTTIFIQSQVPELCQLTVLFLNLVTLARLERNPTVKQEIIAKNFERSLPAGFLTYPVSQAADIVAFDANVVPVGEDQLPMIEQTCEIVDKINSLYGNVLVRPKALIPKVGARLVGIDGKNKMSKSLGNAVYLSEPTDELRKKVMAMYTDPGHLKVSDPGKVEGNVVFEFLDSFCQDGKMVQDLKDHYQRGGLGDVKIKNLLFDCLEAFIAPIREKRKLYEQDKSQVWSILKTGTQAAQARAARTYKRVSQVMGLQYF